MKLLVYLDMEHNHSNLIYGFLLSFFVCGLGVSLAFLSTSGADLHSKIVVIVSATLLISAGVIMLKTTFKKRDNCPICFERYHFGRKK